jgi:raffinose/stachyose/melibiose transport system permease protein
MIRDEVLGNAIRVMLVFLVANCVKFLPTVLVAVVLFHLASARAQYLFRVLFILPMAIPGMVGVLIWKYFYRMDGGVLNTVLLNLNVIRAPVNWLGTEDTVVPALLFIGFPWVSTIGVLILLAGLQNIDQSVFEAALMDGCGVWRRFWNIEMPLVAGQIKLNVVLITIGTIQDFWLPLVLTRGGPNQASMLPGLWMYQSAFSHGKMGYAAALGVAMFLVILTLTWLNMRLISADRTR